MKVFTYVTQPYGFLRFKAELETRTVAKYVPNGGTGHGEPEQALFAVGVVVESDWRSQHSGRQLERHPVGTKFQCRVTQQQWDAGEVCYVAM